MLRVMVLGAGGIIGQHMMKSTPMGVDASFYRREEGHGYGGLDFNDASSILAIKLNQPHVVINLIGENRVDVVEEDPQKYYYINSELPGLLAHACGSVGAKLIQVSSQGVFSGENPPYGPRSLPDPITEYGKQKHLAEHSVSRYHGVTIARVTFVLGVRPIPEIGRANPLEQMFEQKDQKQVCDRWFSPTFAPDTAKQLWKLAASPPETIVHIGEPIRVSRWDIACAVYHDLYLPIEQRPHIEPVSHDYFPGIAPRPRDTTWNFGSMYGAKYIENIQKSYNEWRNR